MDDEGLLSLSPLSLSLTVAERMSHTQQETLFFPPQSMNERGLCVRPSPLVCAMATGGAARRRRPIQPLRGGLWEKRRWLWRARPAGDDAAGEVKSSSPDVTLESQQELLIVILAAIPGSEPGFCFFFLFFFFGRKQCEVAPCVGTDE